MVSFVPLNLCDEDSITNVLIQIDNAIQYGEDLDVREMKVNKVKIISYKDKLLHFQVTYQT